MAQVYILVTAASRARALTLARSLVVAEPVVEVIVMPLRNREEAYRLVGYAFAAVIGLEDVDPEVADYLRPLIRQPQ